MCFWLPDFCSSSFGACLEQNECIKLFRCFHHHRSTNTRVFCYMEITPTQAAGRWGLFLGQVSQHSNEGGAVGPLPSGALLGETSRVTGMHTAAHLHFFQHFEEFCRLKRKEGNLLFDKSRHNASQSKPHHGRDTGPPPWSTCPAP